MTNKPVKLPEAGQWPDKVAPWALLAGIVLSTLGFLMAFLYAGPVNGAAVSILPIVKGKKMPERYIYAEHEGNRMVRKGDWKLVSANFKGDEWELYNIKEDRTEQHNLIGKYPEMAKELETAYFEWADKSDVLYFQKMWNTYNKNRRKDFKEYKTR